MSKVTIDKAVIEKAIHALKIMRHRFMDTEGSYGDWENQAMDAAGEALIILYEALENSNERTMMTCTDIATYQGIQGYIDQAKEDAIFALREALEASSEDVGAIPQPQQEPVAWLFQHEETGRTLCVDTQQVEWGFEKDNPRLQKIAPLYTTTPARNPLTPDEVLSGFCKLPHNTQYVSVFNDGVRFAEVAHGIKL